MTHYRMLDQEPSAIITVAGSEKKIYQNGQIFLNNGENFEIRFFNPLQTKIGVEILFDGIKKNDGYLVLKPGEDVILDRFLDDKKKMLYETYKIDANNPAAVNAAKMNGLIEFKFYKEYFKPINYKLSCKCSSRNCNSISYTSPGIFSHEVDYSDEFNDSIFDASSSATMDNLTLDMNTPIGCYNTSTKNLVETGRIEKGSESEQEMKIVDMQFEPNAFHTIKYQLKPTSQLNVDVSEIRNYCSRCGYRLRKSSWKFCPKCSEKL